MSRARAAAAGCVLALVVSAAVAGCGGGAAGGPTGGSGASGSGASAPRGAAEDGWRVERVVDGDTVVAVRGGDEERVRLIGIDTPETVKPGAPVECFGPEASAFAKERLEGREVTLEYDAQAGQRDRYDRLLAYVWVDGRLFNLQSVRDGYADLYRSGTAYAWYPELAAAQRAAQDSDAGMWGACPAA